MEAPPIRHDARTTAANSSWNATACSVGELTYTLAGSRMTILHTEVDAVLRGGGAARKLVDAAVQWARAENLKVASRCAYASALLIATPQTPAT